LIANPGSGDPSDRGKLLVEVTRSLIELGVKVDVAVAKPKENAQRIAKRAVKDGYKTIIAMGGDDTVEAVIRGIAWSKARLGVIPVGTANDLAKSLGIPLDPQQACALIAAGDFRKVDLGWVKIDKGKKLPFFQLVIVGIVASLYPPSLRVVKSRISKVKELIQKVLEQEAGSKVTVVMDGDSTITVDTMLAIASNVPLIGRNLVVDPYSSTEDGLLDITLYPGFTKAELAVYFARTLNDHKVDDRKIQRYRARRVKIKATPKLEVMADGVMLGKGTAKIKLFPKSLRVYAPEPGAGVEKPPEAAGAELPPPVSPVVENR
jgi:diacylglycerol kinase (ATP)